jgi:hypothetical protein
MTATFNHNQHRSAQGRAGVSVCECGDHAYRTVSGHLVVLVSVVDADLLAMPGWKAQRRRDGRHVVARWFGSGHANRVIRKMHRVITDADDDQVVDHASRDTLDNRRANIRACTHAENTRNRIGVKGRALPKGVTATRRGKFEARIRAGAGRIQIGTFATVEEAAQAYADYARRLHGEFARVA